MSSKYGNIAECLLQSCQLSQRLHLRISAQWASTALATFRKLDEDQEPKNVFEGPRGCFVGHSKHSTPVTPISAFKVPFPPADRPTENSGINGDRSVVGESNIVDNCILEPVYHLVSAAMNLERYKEASNLAQTKMDVIPELRFLYYYSRFLHIERLLSFNYESTNIDPSDKAHFDQLLHKLKLELGNFVEKMARGDAINGPMLFLFGKILRLQGNREQAISVLLEAVRLQPLLFESWLELAESMETRAEVVAYCSLGPKHFLHHLFLGKAYARIGLPDRALSQFTLLQTLGFRDNPDILNEIGKLLMNIEPDESMVVMEKARKFNALRMKDVEYYSHLLFIKDEHVTLRLLMDDIFEAGRYTPECSIALGNFYGLMGDHEKAVMSFMKALKFNPLLYHVWTLIGHEQVELKQTELAMRSYENAVDADPKEYRAWYGLGQTLEILRAHASALYYFRKAFEYCPNDTRMLLALADTFLLVESNSDAEICYWRAYQINNDILILVRLARLYEKLGRYGRAAELYVKYTMDVQALSEEPGEPAMADRDDAEDLGYAYLYLSKYYLLHHLFDNAAQEAKAAENFLAVKDEAYAMLKQISRMKTEYSENDGKSKEIDPVRLGFPLWTEPVQLEEHATENGGTVVNRK